MAKFSFGEAISEDDILEIQGKEYRLLPFGMRAFRETMQRAQEVDQIKELEGSAKTERTYEMSVGVIIGSVHPEDRERLAEHIEHSVSPGMVSNIAAAIMRGLSDVDPTPPTSSSDGSSETGDGSTDGVPDEVSTSDN